MQTKILNELGMIENENIQHDEVEEKHVADIVDSSALNIKLSNPSLVNMLKPYSNDYIEMIIMQCMSKESTTSGISHELIDTVESIYLIVSMLLVLFIVDIIFRMKIKL
jgi:hypothetical protein